MDMTEADRAKLAELQRGIEIEQDEGDMETYDDRGEPVSIGRL